MISRRRILTAIALAAAVALFLSVRLANPGLHSDEITYMSSAVDSMTLGRVLPVQANGALFINKPPLGLWLIRGTFEILDPGPFAARLPSVLAAALVAAVLYLFGASLWGEAVGLLAALFFVLTPGLSLLHGIRSATPDALEILLITSAIVALEGWRRRRRPWMLAALVVCVGASAGVKSPFALIVFLTYLLATEWTARRAGHGTPRLGLTLALVAGVWIGAYGLWLATLSADTSTRAVYRRLLVQQYMRRIEGRLGRHHIAGPDFYLDSVTRDFGPLLLLPAGAAAVVWLAARRGRRSPDPLAEHRAVSLVVWSLAAPVLATASVNKLAWYAYLSYPGMALLVAVSARRLAQAVAARRSVQAALLAASVLVPAWRVPAGLLWPAEPQSRGPARTLWEIARRDPRIAVDRAPDFRFSCRQEDACREARFFLKALFWRQAERTRPGSCRAILIHHRRQLPARGRDVVVLRRPSGRGSGLFLIDRCDGKLRDQLSGKQP